MKSWLLVLITLLAGLGLGLAYGWVISPVEYVDTSPATLRADFRTDYVLMVAEIHASENNPELAARRMALLGSNNGVTALVSEALTHAQSLGYPPQDITLLETLLNALQAWEGAPQ